MTNHKFEQIEKNLSSKKADIKTEDIHDFNNYIYGIIIANTKYSKVVSSHLFYLLDMVNKIFCSIVYENNVNKKTFNKAFNKAINDYELIKEQNNTELLEYIKTYKNKDIFDTLVQSGKTILNSLYGGESVEKLETQNAYEQRAITFLNDIKLNYIIYLPIFNDNQDLNTNIIPKLNIIKNNDDKNNDDKKNVKVFSIDYFATYVDNSQFSYEQFTKTLNHLTNIRNFLNHPKDENEKIQRNKIFSSLYIIFNILPQEINFQFCQQFNVSKSDKDDMKNKKAKIKNILNYLLKLSNNAKKEYTQYLYTEFFTKPKEKKNHTSDEQKKLIKQKQKRKMFLNGINKKSGHSNEIAQWRREFNDYVAYNTKDDKNKGSDDLKTTFKHITFKRNYYFIGSTNINNIKDYLTEKTKYTKIHFLHIKKFYLSILDMQKLYSYYFHRYYSDDKKANKEYENITKHRNILAHNVSWWKDGNDTNFKSMFNAVNELIETFAENEQEKHDEKNTLAMAINNILDRMKLPIINEQITSNLNYKRQKPKYHEKKNNSFNKSNALIKIAKMYKKDLDLFKKQIIYL